MRSERMDQVEFKHTMINGHGHRVNQSQGIPTVARVLPTTGIYHPHPRPRDLALHSALDIPVVNMSFSKLPIELKEQIIKYFVKDVSVVCSWRAGMTSSKTFQDSLYRCMRLTCSRGFTQYHSQGNHRPRACNGLSNLQSAQPAGIRSQVPRSTGHEGLPECKSRLATTSSLHR